MKPILLLLSLLMALPVFATDLRVESIDMISAEGRLADYGAWRFEAVTQENLAEDFRPVIVSAGKTPVGSYQEENGYYRFLSHREPGTGPGGKIYHALDWKIDKRFHETAWYHLYDRRPDKETTARLKKAFYASVSKADLQAVRRNIYDGDTDWPYDLIDYLAGSLETPVIRITLLNTSNQPAQISSVRFTHLLSWGDDADAEVIEMKSGPADVIAVLNWKRTQQRFPLTTPLVIAAGEKAHLDISMKVEDAAAGDGDGSLLTLLEADVESGNKQSSLRLSAFVLHDSLRDLAY